METDKKQLIKVVCTCLLGTLMFGGVGAYLFFGNDPSVDQNEKILYSAIAGFLMLLCIATAALFIFSYKKKQAPEDGKTDDDIKRESAVHKKLPGKDMYEVIRLYRRRNYQTRIIAISIACVLIVFMFLIKMCGDYGMDYRIAIALGVLTIILSFVVCGRKEFSYSKELDFKKAIAESGADPVRLNADFMIGAHFMMRDGLLVLGRDYLVIFAKDLCTVLDVADIEKAATDRFTSSIQGSKITTYRVKFIKHNGNWWRVSLRDRKETELMLNELRLRGIIYEDFGEKTEKEIKAERNKK
ncbi:MAG: hypothetical protein IKH06_02825 [Clostridiales bacterium]|nr:hypothetical protein [Clostridiales bacterium]